MFPDYGNAPIKLALDFGGYEDDWRHVASFRGQSGWLLTAQITVQTEFDLLTQQINVACDDRETPIPSWRAIHLTQCPWSRIEQSFEEPPDILDDLLCEEEGALYARWQMEANKDLAKLHEEAKRSIDALEGEADSAIRRLGREINDLRRRRRMTNDDEARGIFSRIIAQLEEDVERNVEALTHSRNELRRRLESTEEAMWQRTDVLIETEAVQIIRWRDGHAHPEHRKARVWKAGRYYSHDPGMSDATLKEMQKSIWEANERAAQAKKRPSRTTEVVDIPKTIPRPQTKGPQPTKTTSNKPKANGPVNRVADQIAKRVAQAEQALAGTLARLQAESAGTPRRKRLQIKYDYVHRQLEFARANLARLREADVPAQPVSASPHLFDAATASAHTVQAIKTVHQDENVIGADDQFWTDKRVVMLRELWSQGFPASQIGAALGGASRNSVLSKARRLGIYTPAQNGGRQTSTEPVSTNS